MIKSIIACIKDRVRKKDPFEEHFKTKEVYDRYKYLHPMCKTIIMDSIEFCRKHGFHLIITDTVSTVVEDIRLGRKSSTHREARAFDVRTMGMPEVLINQLVSHLETTYGHIGAISPKSKKPRLIIRHDSGHGDHLHVQLNRGYALPLLKGRA